MPTRAATYRGAHLPLLWLIFTSTGTPVRNPSPDHLQGRLPVQGGGCPWNGRYWGSSQSCGGVTQWFRKENASALGKVRKAELGHPVPSTISKPVGNWP